jgi:hypothetical protein
MSGSLFKGNSMAREPNWQPISAIPLIAELVDGMLQDAEENFATLNEARSRPYVLDDATIDRVVEVYTTQGEFVPAFEEQLSRWLKESLTHKQHSEVQRLSRQVARLREVHSAVMSLAAELREGTIEKVLAKDDVELGLEVLLGKIER